MEEDSPGTERQRRRAIVLIPGFKREERGLRAAILADNIAAAVESRRLAVAKTAAIAGEAGHSLTAATIRGSVPGRDGPDRVDIFEAYWADMIPNMAEAGPLDKIWSGLNLLVYWLFNWRILGATRISPAISIGLFAGGAIMVLWYVSVLLVAIEALGQADLPDFLKDSAAAQQVLDSIKALAKQVSGLEIWIAAGILLRVMHADDLVDLARFNRDYLENRVIPNSEDKRQVGLKDRLRERVIATLERVMAEPYDEVVLLSHSFGTVIAVDLLRDWPHEDDFRRLALVTLGSPIGVLSYRSPWLKDELDGLLGGKRLARWTDFYSGSDWLCSSVPGQAKAFPEHSIRLDFEAPLAERASGRTHMLYYRDPRVLTRLVSNFD
jgi:hypothetical protein